MPRPGKAAGSWSVRTRQRPGGSYPCSVFLSVAVQVAVAQLVETRRLGRGQSALVVLLELETHLCPPGRGADTMPPFRSPGLAARAGALRPGDALQDGRRLLRHDAPPRGVRPGSRTGC